MGNLELSVINIIYNAILLVFEKREDNSLILLSTYGNINDNEKILLNVCF